MPTVAPRRTKIVATVGPACSTPETLRALVDAGMDAARLNLSHGTHEDHAARAKLVRDVQEDVGRPLALIGDLQGPKFRVGGLDQPLDLPQGGEVTIVLGDGAARNGELPIAPAAIGGVLRPGHEVLINDGMIRLRVDEVEAGRARCGIIVGGEVTSHKGVNLPGVPIPIPSLTRKDLEDLEFALELGCDFIALSFVRSAADVRDLKALIEQEGSHGTRDREDREVGGGRRARRHPRRVRRGHGCARRPRCGDRTGARPAAAEADHREGSRTWKAGDHRHPDARVDDPSSRSRRAPRRATWRTRSSTGRRR